MQIVVQASIEQTYFPEGYQGLLRKLQKVKLLIAELLFGTTGSSPRPD